ncbi:MAG TPA: ABC transporter permease [Bryobacteraceae bacterium]|nr:ABC transporter permease [Bryobacteraceae bacterium]
MDYLRALWQDFRYGARQLRLNPGFAAVAVLSLGLGIGANTAIFELVNAVRLRTLPVAKPEELAYVDFRKGSVRNGNFSTRSARFTWRQWQQIQAQQQAFSGVMAWSARRFNLSPSGEVRWAEGLFVSSNFFSVLGVEPAIGRAFTADEDRPGCPAPAAVISYGFWQQEFGGAADVLGRKVTLDGHSFPILGVTPRGFFGVEVGNRYDVAIPSCADAQMSADGKGRAASTRQWWLSVIGRLKPGWTVARADAQFLAISPGFMQATLPESYRPEEAKKYLEKNKLAVTPGANGVSGLRRTYEQPLWLLLATTGLVLLIACANLANLLLARASVREREIAVRQAIGASRPRLIAQLMAESLLLATAGTALGAGLSIALSRGLVAFLSEANSGLLLGLGFDARVLGFAAGIAVLTCVLFGLAPALRATRIAPASAMRSGGRGLTAGKERFSLRRGLVVAQVALSLVLLVGALLFMGSLRKLMAVDPGFRVSGLVAADLDFQRAHYPKERNVEVHRELLERLRALPGVTGAAELNILPLSGNGWNELCWAEGDAKRQVSWFNGVTPGYFKTMDTPLLAGRDFDTRDTVSSPKVAIVNETFARKIFGGGNPVGRTFFVEGDAGEPDDRYQVVGLVRNTTYQEVREDASPISYTALGQQKNFGAGAQIVLRTSAPLGELFRSVKAAAAEVSPATSVEFTVLTKQLADTLLRDRLMATLAGAFGLLAGVLATIGLYGVMAYTVARRRNEIGIRIALGAGRAGVVGLVLREAAVLLGCGLAIGVGLALWLGRAARSLLFGLKPSDGATLAAAMLLLAAVALAASFVPARRASRLEPMQALREE